MAEQEGRACILSALTHNSLAEAERKPRQAGRMASLSPVEMKTYNLDFRWNFIERFI